METKHKSGCALIVLLTLGGFATVLYQFNKALGIHDQRVVQILDSEDGKTRVELVRRYDFLDLNFLVFINGEKIYTSPDLKNKYRLPYRETVCWDQTGKNLILEIAGRRLFGYNLPANRRLSDRELLTLKIRNATPEELGLEGEWPSRDTISVP